MTERIEFRGKQNVAAPFAHYLALYQAASPAEIAARTGLAWDAARTRFSLRLVGADYYVIHPDFLVVDAETCDADATADKERDGNLGLHAAVDAILAPYPEAAVLRNPYEEILIIRYLLEGKHVPAAGRRLAYSEMGWGQIYRAQFNGRVLGRLAREFGRDADGLRRAAENMPDGLREALRGNCDVGYRLEFLSDLWLSVLLWEGDAEFPPSAQILFDDNFRHAFTAEDMAVCGDILIGRLKKYREKG